MDSTLDAVKRRREEESQSATGPAGYAPEEKRAGEQVFKRLLKKAPDAPIVAAPHTAVWIQGYGGREDRRESTLPGFPALGGVPGAALPPQGPNQNLVLTADLSRVSTTSGVLGGYDVTWAGKYEALLVGFLAGYQSTHIRYKTTTNTADIDGPSFGAYLAYVLGNFSTDVGVKIDTLSQEQTFSNFAGSVFATAGTNSVNLTNYALAANVNYRLLVARGWFVEPTAGVLRTRTDYQAAALAIGLEDSTGTRLQAGVRVGSNWRLSYINVYTALTALAFNTVQFSGGATTQNGFAGTTVPTDKGKTFGQFLLANNLDLGRGFSLQADGAVQFRSGVLGVGGKGGLRYTW
jgi:outer membrane autotransporter protein